MKLIQGIVALFTSIGLLFSSALGAAGITIDIDAQVGGALSNVSISDKEAIATAAAPLVGVPVIPEFGVNVGSSKLTIEGVGAEALALGDMDGDGDQDVIAASSNLGLHIGYNNATTGPAVQAGVCAWGGNFAVEDVNRYKYSDIAISDFNGDAKRDFIAVSLDGPSLVFVNGGNFDYEFIEDEVLKSTRLPCFYIYDVSSYSAQDVRVSTSSVAVGDVNKDGLPDVVFGNRGKANTLVLNDFEDDLTANPFEGGYILPVGFDPNNGDINDVLDQLEWLSQSITTDSYKTVDIELADINKDGFLDVVAVNENAPSARAVSIIYHNQGQEPYNDSSIDKHFSSSTRTLNKVTIADFDKDGDNDIVVATNKNDPNFYFYRTDSGYRFTLKKIKKPFQGDMEAISSADVNLDGYVDLIVSFNDLTGEHENVTQVYLNDRADYSFSSTLGITIGSNSALYGSSIAVADINLNGFLDIAVANTQSVERTYFNGLIVDELAPQIEITELFDNAIILTPEDAHEITINAVDYSGINSFFARGSLKDSNGNYGDPIILVDEDGGAVYSQDYSFKLLVSDGQAYKIEMVITDRAGNNYSHALEYQYSSDTAVLDSDGDQMLDSWETTHGFDPLDPLDSASDKDEDGLTNVEEFVAETNPLKSDTDSDGYSDSEEVGYGTNPLFTHPRPMADFTIDQFVDEDSEVTVDVYLRTMAAVYPVVINIVVSDESTAMEGTDFEIDSLPLIVDEDNERSFKLVINEGNKGSFKLKVAKDGIAEGRENIILQMTTLEHSVLGVKEAITLTIVEENVAPTSNLTVMQNSRVSRIIAKQQGTVTVSVNAGDVNSEDRHVVDWNFVDNFVAGNVSADAQSVSFEPSGLEKGIYTVEATVTDNGTPNLQVKSSISIKVMGSIKSENELLDDNDNGISNAFDRGTENYQLTARSGSGLEGLISTSPGLKLSLGATALAGNARDGEVSLAEIQGYMADKTTHSLIDEIENIGGYYDFDVNGLPVSGMTVDIVIPLRVEIPRGGVYRKFNPQSGWTNFVENSTNRIGSALIENGICPPAGSDKYSVGLVPFTQCVQLSIEDGGPNDMDGIVNSAIKDPGGIAIQPEPEEEEAEEEQTASNGGGGGSADWFILMIMLFGGVWRIRRFVR